MFSLIFLAALSDLPPLESEFEEYIEFETIDRTEKKKTQEIIVVEPPEPTEEIIVVEPPGITEEVIVVDQGEKIEEPVEIQDLEDIVFNPDLIPAQENHSELIAYLQEFPQAELPSEELEEDFKMLFQRYVKKGMTVVDYGAGSGTAVMTLARLVGDEGKVIAFESRPELFRQMYWRLVNNRIKNVSLYCNVLIEKENIFDSFRFENISIMQIHAQGREDIFLKGAAQTLSKSKPILFVHMLGGIPIEMADRFVRQEFHKRLEQIQKMGYSTQRIKGSDYLALPKN